MNNQKKAINTFQRYLSVWVLLCMAAGVLIGHFVPAVPAALGRLQISGISIPIAVLIWIMIYPMMMKVDFQSVRQIGKNPKGLVLTWIVNWLIKPFTMYGIAYLFLFVVFKSLIAPELATQYLAGAVLLGAAPCTAMVFVWSALTKGNPAYTVVQVATNDLIILVAFVPIVKFLLGVSNVAVPYSTLFVSILLFVVIPLAGGILTRMAVIRQKGADYFENTFIHRFDNATT
ncbi:MAG: bile acid:sodium symporter, partial [Lachnospira sp.]|nr:bile acid:sodium symporter [Lachnospira sp.]